MIKIGIVGGTGYTGVELLRLLSQHPQAQLRAITSRKEAGMPVADMFPSLRGRVSLAFCEPERAELAHCDLVFFATPNGVAMQQVPALLAAGVRVIDLAADFRLRDIPTWNQWYGMEHACPDAVREAVYRRSLPLAIKELRIETSALGAAGGVLGAAAMVMDEIFVPERLGEWVVNGLPGADRTRKES